MTIGRITTLAASSESETLEFKDPTGTRRDTTRTVCAFLNHGGGQVPFKLMKEDVRVGVLELGRLRLRRVLER